jgi:hypothetical protein
MNALPFTPGATVSVAATTSTGNVALTGNGEQLEVQNTGAVTVFVNLGTSAVTAAVTDYPVLAGQSKLITRNPDGHTYLAAITASGTATVYVTIGRGA